MCTVEVEPKPTRAMAFQRQLHVALVLLCSGVFLRGAAQPYTLNVDPQGNTIKLECVDDDNNPVDDPTVEYRYRPPTLTGGSLRVFVTLNGDIRRAVTFELTPQTEGEYFCRTNGANGALSGSQDLVAFPLPISSIAALTAYTIRRGENLELDCDFEEGALSSRYIFKWFRIHSGFLEQLYDGTETSDSMRFEVVQSTQNGRTLNSFRITGVEFDDESDQYYCEVMITDPTGSNPDRATGRFIQVDVYDPVHVEMEANPQVVLEGDRYTAEFQCVFEGDPAPSIRWRLNGDEILSGGESGRFIINTPSPQIRSVTSTFTVRGTKALYNGVVECQATHVNSLGNQFTAASNTTLTVLSRNIDDLFLTTTTSRNDPVVFLHFMLPARFVTPVNVRVSGRYTDVDSDESSPFDYDNVFGDTTEVNYRIPGVPRFDNFRTQINFSSAEITTGPFVSEPIAVLRAAPDDLQPSNDDGFLFSLNFIGVVVAVVIIAVVGMIVAVVGVVCHKRSGVNRLKTEIAELKTKIKSLEQRRLQPDGDSSEVVKLSETKYTVYIPWQASFEELGVSSDRWSGAPWQADQYLLVYEHTETFEKGENESEIERKSITESTTVNIPWQAVLQECSLAWQATQVQFEYQYWIQETKRKAENPQLQANETGPQHVERGAEGSDEVAIDIPSSPIIREHQETDSQRESGDKHLGTADQGGTIGNTIIDGTHKQQQNIVELQTFNENGVLYYEYLEGKHTL